MGEDKPSRELRREIEAGNYAAAIAQARAITTSGRGTTLGAAIGLTLLAADEDPAAFERYALRVIDRLRAQRCVPSEHVADAATTLADLGAGRIDRAAAWTALNAIWPTPDLPG